MKLYSLNPLNFSKSRSNLRATAIAKQPSRSNLRYLLCLLLLAPCAFAQLPQPVQVDHVSLDKPALAATPPMGWNSWNKFGCDINEDLIRTVADAMVSSGLRDAGYIYLNLDDCWHGERDNLGFIHEDTTRFPSGIKALADYVHSKGLKIGIYSDAGSETCGGRPGSQGHEYQDAITYASWGIDYLKYDWCNTDSRDAKEAYSLMAKALRQSGRDILFSLCEWGNNKAYEWAEPIGHCWRTTGDITCCFDCTLDHGGWQSLGIMTIVDSNEKLRKYAGPNHWNDPDMLEVGNGMSHSEDRAQFTLWCMMAAPLIVGNDIRSMSKETAAILLNKELIAVDQDSLGIQGLRHRTEAGLEYWLKPLANGDWAFCVLNRSLEERTINLDFRSFQMYDNLSRRSLETSWHTYQVRNLWSHQDEQDTTHPRQVTIPSHDVVAYRLIW